MMTFLELYGLINERIQVIRDPDPLSAASLRAAVRKDESGSSAKLMRERF